MPKNLKLKIVHDQQCNARCSQSHAEDSAKCQQSYPATSRLFAACINTVNSKQDECRAQCGTKTREFQDCLILCHRRFLVELKPCDTTFISQCVLGALIQADQCDTHCRDQFEIQSKTAEDRIVCYTLVMESIRRSTHRCSPVGNGYVRVDCRRKCMGSVQVSSEYCDNNFPVNDQGNPVKVHPKLPELPSCWK
ncbi:unnamed protein product [Mortierella alpina]